MNVEMKGMKELVARLEAAKVAMAGPEMRKALRAGAQVIQAAIQERAPILDMRTVGSDALPPGALKDSIHISVTPEGEEPVVATIAPSKKTAYVASFVEYGHREVHGGELKLLGNGRTRGSGVSGKDVPAHPFIRPAFEASVGEAQEAIAESLRKSFQEVLS